MASVKSDTKKIGGLAARNNEGPLWQFTSDNNGTFIAPDAEYISRLYFPLMNEKGLKCSVTPELKGDICSSFDKYLTIATVTEELHRTVSGRNFWIKPEKGEPWSAAGSSAFQKSKKWTADRDRSEATGKIGSFTLTRCNHKLGIKSDIIVFVPANDDPVEIMKVTITNTGNEELTFIPYSAMPIFGRHADNIRDHRQVTTMFQRTHILKDGVMVFPTIVHDERGHTVNQTKYISIGYTANGYKPETVWGDLYEFIGQGGSLDNPEAVYTEKDSLSKTGDMIEGKEAVSALRFKKITLNPCQSTTYILINGITENKSDIEKWRKRYASVNLVDQRLDKTHSYWQNLVNNVRFETSNSDFDNWMRWVSFQLKCRQIYGNSYLPDFGYGRGGRGWRDLWQDLLSIFLVDPKNAREEMINSFRGIRIDGSNATIIGNQSGEFKADRNNVPRTWSDHGVWPAFVLNFYIQQSGDYDILFQESTYWKDKFTHRSRGRDLNWNEAYGTIQKTNDNDIYKATIFEHILIQQLSAFYNVGEHNILLLEGADWNDTLDMARERGESVCFYSFYGYNLTLLADLLQDLYEKKIEQIEIFSEILPLLDRLPNQNLINYNNPVEKQNQLKKYFDSVKHDVNGKKVKVNIQDLIKDLREKSESVFKQIREKEWICTKDGESFFNGHYDNDGQPVHGDHELGVRMDLTSQVIPIMCGAATNEQIPKIYSAVNRYLKENGKKGLRLCTDFKELKLNLGRITGFVYGHKEHGSKWMQQNIMFMYGLFNSGYICKGHQILDDIFDLCMNSGTAGIFPGIPSYFEPEDHGRYMYLTASPAWLLITLVTQIFGIRGEKGLLCIHPKLKREQFNQNDQIVFTSKFRGKPIQIIFNNPDRLNWDEYAIGKIVLNGRDATADFKIDQAKVLYESESLEFLSSEILNKIEIFLRKTNKSII
ncbi:MAG: cellobiose phosphorylase [Calditrichaceae bacterium]|nr:cellobiose phosphorylase [Calditrichaceae bacterium]